MKSSIFGLGIKGSISEPLRIYCAGSLAKNHMSGSR